MTQFLDKIGLNYFWQKIKQTFPTRNEILDSEEAVSAALNDLNTRIPENISEFITGSDLKTINGQQITGNGDISINFYGESSTPAATVQKEVSIPSITTLNVGQFIIVKPTITSTVANSTIKLNSFDAYPMRYNNAAITTSTDSVVWNASYPSIFVFDGSYWVFAGHGLDSNTTYSGMTQAEATAGTATTNRLISAKVLNDTISEKTPKLKTINNQSLLGEGNITIEGGSDGETNVIESVKVNGTALTPDSNKAVNIQSIPAGIVSQDGTHRFVSDTEKSTWNGKQNAISDLEAIRSNASAGAAKVSNVQADWNATTGDAVILNKPTIPTKTSQLTNDSNFLTEDDVQRFFTGTQTISENQDIAGSKDGDIYMKTS